MIILIIRKPLRGGKFIGEIKDYQKLGTLIKDYTMFRQVEGWYEGRLIFRSYPMPIKQAKNLVNLADKETSGYFLACWI